MDGNAEGVDISSTCTPFKVWDKLFPFVRGDRVRVIGASKYEKVYQCVFVGRYGVVDAIIRRDMYIRFDNAIHGHITQMHVSQDDIRRVRPYQHHKKSGISSSNTKSTS